MRTKNLKTRVLTGTTDPGVQPYEQAHRDIARRAAADSIVLLKNEGALLPVSPDTPIALYGAGASHTIKGGTGSGDVNERHTVSIAEGLEQAGYEITTRDWLDDYNRAYDEARQAWKDAIWAELDGTDADDLALFDVYCRHSFAVPAGSPEIRKTRADLAVYVLSRVAGEGADRYAQKGDYDLSDEEDALVRAVCAAYPKVVLVLNTGGQVDLSFTDEYENIAAILLISQPGCEGGNGFADVFSGKVSPAGKLAATWAFRYGDYPSSATFSHNNGNVDKEYYGEGIYVGYRYFDTFQVPVRYGFGFGLGYTEFALRPETLTRSGLGTQKDAFCLPVTVTNVGRTHAGREVVQVYASCPQDGMTKEYRRLVGFAKTEVLAPGESQEVTVPFSADALASYREETPGWVLEMGIYGIFVGNSLESSVLAGSIQVKRDTVLTRTEHICPVPEKERALLRELAPSSQALEARRDAWLGQTELLPKITLEDGALGTETVHYGGEYHRLPEDVRDFVDTLSEDQLIQLATGDPGQGQLADANLGSAGSSVPGSAAQSSDCARDLGLADIVFADGPAGLRIYKNYYVKDGTVVQEGLVKGLEGGFLSREETAPEGEAYFQFCTAFPVGTGLAQTWDLELVSEVGQAVAREMQVFLISSWLAPGMNIQRNPLCGRNFEYFSEDPLVSGRMAAAMTKGVQSEPGCFTTIKHFACNNQEDNRMGSDSVLSERALREIYLKGFELAIKESHPAMIMTSYNLVNGIHSANNYDLCTKAARDEWGFDGMIMTDWTTTHNGPDCTAAGCMRAGNDMVMPGRIADQENIRQALRDGSLDLLDLKTCVGHLVRAVWNSNMYE